MRAPRGPGCCGTGVLQARGAACSGDAVGHGGSGTMGAAIPTLGGLGGGWPWRWVAVVAGLGTRWARWSAEGPGGGFAMSRVERGAGRQRALPWPCLQCGAWAGAAGRMLRKRREAEGSKGDGEAGGRLARGAEVSLARPGQDQSADVGRCHGSGERSDHATRHRQPRAMALRWLPGPTVPAAGSGARCASRGGIFDRGGGGHRMCTKVITIPNL